MQPFSNIRVIDLTHVIAGPFCTYQLAVLGADVIKIEHPEMPDSVRQDGASDTLNEKGMGSVFLAQNANKRSLALDLKSDEAKAIMGQLISNADVLVENYRAGAMDALGFGYDQVKAVKSDIIYCSLTGYGQQGPLAGRTAYDNVIQAISGLMAATGDDETAPVKVGPPVLDYGTGVQAAFAIAAALFQRTVTGIGQRIDIAMLDAAMMLTSTSATHLTTSGGLPSLTGNSSAANAGYGCFSTRQGLIMIGAYTGEQLYNAWKVMGDEEHGLQLRHLASYEMRQHQQSDYSRIAAIMLTADADEWEQRFNEAKVPAARVRTFDETAAHPQVAARSVLQSVELEGDRIPLPTAAFNFEHGGPQLHTPPPRHGEHTREILEQAGFDSEQIEQFDRAGTIKLD